MSYIGIADDTIKKLAIEAMRYEEGDIKYEKKKFVNFHKKQMPKNILHTNVKQIAQKIQIKFKIQI